MTVYFIRAKGTGLVKIGFTDGDVEVRRRALQVGCPHELVIERTLDGDESLEEDLHDRFEEQRRRGEWFELDVTAVSDLSELLSSLERPRARHARAVLGDPVFLMFETGIQCAENLDRARDYCIGCGARQIESCGAKCSDGCFMAALRALREAMGIG